MGLVQLQVIWHLLNICMVCVLFGGSSGFGEPLLLDSYSPISSIEPQAPRSRSEPGSVLQPPTVTSSAKLAPSHQNDEGPPPIPSFRDSSPPLSAEPSDESVDPAVKPHVAELAHAPSALILPVATSPPPVPESAHAPSALVPPLDTTPPPIVEPPHAFEIPLPAKPPQVFITGPPVKAPPFLPTPPPKESPQHASIVELSPLPLPVLSPPSQLGPSQISPPTALVPSNASVPPPLVLPFPLEGQPPPSSPPLTAKPPHVSIPEIPVEEPPSLPTPQISPQPLPVFSPLPPLPSSPPVNEPALYEPPPPAYESPPFVVSPSVLPGAEPPHASSLPLPAHPPDTSPLLPVGEPPNPLTLVPPSGSQPVFPSPPPASATQSPPIPVIRFSPPPQSVPSIASSPVSQLEPVNASSPAASSIQIPPAIVSSPPPQLPSLNASSPVPPIVPHGSPPTQALPPSSSFSPPLMVSPPLNSPPDLPTLPPPGPQNTSSPPPQLFVPPPASPPTSVFPTPALPPSSSFSPPLMVPPPMNSPPHNASSLPPQMGPPLVSYPPPQFVFPPPASPPTSLFPTPALPPSSSFSPPLIVPPPMDSPPHSLPPFPPVPQNTSSPPASPPTSALPSISPPPVMPSLPPPMPPPSSAMSPPLPSQAVPPLPHLVPPHSYSPPLAEPPQVFSAPPPGKIPGAIPPRGSSPPIFSSPPLASPERKKGSHVSVSPPLKAPSHDLLTPPPSTVLAVPPRSSQGKATHQASPPLQETPPPSGISPRAAPPSKQVKPESSPPLEQPIEAPKHSAKLNGSEPHSPPLPAPAPRNKPDGGTAPRPLPPPQEPDQLSPANISPHHAPSKPKFETHNGTAPAPSTVQVNPSVNATHNPRDHVAGAPSVVAPLPSPHRFHKIFTATSPVSHPPPSDSELPLLSPKISPSESSPRNTKKSLSPPIQSLPPPPPNTDCGYLTCQEPSTNTLPGSPCGCVWPMQVGMRLSVALYTFFPLVSELSQEIASGVFLKKIQVRVMGANAAPQDPEKTIVIANLVPFDDKFDNITSHLISDRFWNKKVIIDKSIFGDYDILYVRYPGLPPSPPLAPADMAVINGMPYSVGDPNASKLHPLGVDVTKQGHKHRVNAIIIAVIVLSAVLGLLMCCAFAWVLVFRHTNNSEQPTLTPRAVASLGRSSGPTGLSTGSGNSSPPASLGSSLATYTGSAKTFSGREMEKATDNFNPSRILGEGGFGLVYSGDLDDETRVAVKVLKRDDQQGGREFLAEVEMLSRLHHRNLVKLIGICTDERMRCLVYELIENGSVDSHLHGTDRDIAPLDWTSRIKIALGAARGLAYLHEDSSPRVIHRDFKSSNILLENDFTAKVSDFGLARTALDEENRHISTRVMGTFGYVAPEYAMTGHLLVKSDVYSYGVVLLELLTGRKPVDMSQPDGQENLVAWTRPLLTSKEGLESIIDPSLGSQVPFESVAKVAAIASMCVQPEVSHRPFMGEVVQALKLVCNECDDSKDGDSRSHSRENLSIDFDAKVSSPVSGTHEPLQGQFSLPNFEPRHDVEKGMSVSEIFSASASLGGQASDSFRRHSASGPLRTARRPQFWQKIRGRSRGSVSEHGIMYKLWAGSA